MIKSKPLPSIERLYEVFYVDAEGRLFWKVKPSSKANFIKLNEQITTPNVDGYYKVTLDGKTYPVHRVVWALLTGEDPGNFSIDHIDGDVTNNCPNNLRLVTPKQNAANRVPGKASNTGEPYIIYAPRQSRPRPYRVRVKSHYLGHFATLAEAVLARDAKLAQLRQNPDPYDISVCRAK